MYRWWMPLAYTDDAELRQELRDIAAGGAGGVEVSPFIVPGKEHQTNAFLAQYGWGTPAWEHKIEVITDEALKLGLEVDQNLGPSYPPTVPTLNSFNQPEAEQQLVYGREFVPAGTSRSGALPAPVKALPSVTAKVCQPSNAGDEVLHLASIGGFAVGDVITVGSGSTAERVTVTALGDRTALCADLHVTPLAHAHDTPENAVNVARTTRIKTLVAQCTAACSSADTGSIALDPATVKDVTDQVDNDTLSYSFSQGNGNPWVVIDFLQTASGLIAQSGGYTETQPNYVVDHWSQGGAQIQADFWDENILTKPVQDNLDAIGRGSIFEDSLELGTTQKWTWDFLQSFQDDRGYDPTLLLPALAGADIQGGGTPAFSLGEVGAKLREDYRQTLSDLYTSQYVTPMQAWAQSHGLQFRVQSYGTPISSADAASAAGIPEGESLNFNGDSTHRLAEQDYRVLAGGAHASGKNVISTECCAAFFGNFRSSLAGPNVGGQYTQGGDGTQVGGKYSQGLLDSIYQAYAGGVNQLMWHGYPYRDAPQGTGTAGRDGGTWPGYHPWDIFGALNVNDEFGPRQASWPDYAEVNESIARTQLALRQGHSASDVAVFYADLGLSGNSVGTQQVSATTTQHLLGNDSATSRAGYTYEYLSPGILDDATPDADGGLFGTTAGYRALVLNDQQTIAPSAARRLLALAKDGLRIFVVGAVPSVPAGASQDGAALDGVIADLLAQPSVTQVSNETALPAALSDAGIRPAAAPAEPTSALGLVRREAANATYEYVYNRSAQTVSTDLTLAGSGTPYLLDTWSGKITPIRNYSTSTAGTTVPVRIAAYDKVIIALAKPSAGLGAAPTLHATGGQAEVVARADSGVTVRADHNGSYTTPLSDGTERTFTVDDVATAQPLTSWTLKAQTWGPGANEYTTIKTDRPDISLSAGEDGRLPSWRQITGPVDLSTSSGIGTYISSFDLPATWAGGDGAYLALGDVLDSATVTVNGTAVTVNQSDRNRIDLGHTLHVGTNTLVVRVATTMFNAVRSTGDSNYQTPPWQNTGLMGPVTLTPYRDVVLPAASAPVPVPTPSEGTTPPVPVPSTNPTPQPPATSTPPKAPTETAVRVTQQRVPAGKRAKVVVHVTSPSGVRVQGRVRIAIDGHVRVRTRVTGGRVVLRLPKLAAGKHRVAITFVGASGLQKSRSVTVLKVVKRR